MCAHTCHGICVEVRGQFRSQFPTSVEGSGDQTQDVGFAEQVILPTGPRFGSWKMSDLVKTRKRVDILTTSTAAFLLFKRRCMLLVHTVLFLLKLNNIALSQTEERRAEVD